MRRYVLNSGILLLLLLANSARYHLCYSEEHTNKPIREFLRNRIEAAGVSPKLTVGDEPVFASMMLPRFYERRFYLPAWSDENGPTFQAKDLINEIKEAKQEGLWPEDYHLAKIESIMSEIHRSKERKTPLNPRMLVDLELLLTDAFLIYGSHLLSGKVNPESIDSLI